MPWAPRPPRPRALVKARARAFRWRKMLEDLARAKGVAPSYVLLLTLLAPDTVEAILDGRQPEDLQPDDLPDGIAVEWEAHGPKPAGLYSPVSSVEE